MYLFLVFRGSKNVDHIRDNLDILDFKLTDEEMAEIAKLDKCERYYHRTDEQLAGFAAWRPAFEMKIPGSITAPVQAEEIMILE